MLPHTRAMVASAAFATITGKKVAGIYDHSAGRNLQIAAEAVDNKVQGFDGDRAAAFGGTLPELYDAGDKVFVSLDVNATHAKGYDRGSSTFYTAQVSDGVVQVYDYEHAAWFAYDIQDAASERSFHRK